jgi:dephospho-CoA kinase
VDRLVVKDSAAADFTPSPGLMRVGLTGGIGSGKSTVAAMLVQCGAHLVDTDAIARALTAAGGAAMPAIRDSFGDAAVNPDGALNRDAMRRMAFEHADVKAQLEAILHPLIGQASQQEAALHGGRPVVFDVPLLTESQGSRPWRARVHRVWVVDCLEATQISRVMQRPGWSEDAARRVIAQQATRAARRAIADAVIFNDALGLDALRSQVQTLWNNLLRHDLSR